jgi:hypothetical protein
LISEEFGKINHVKERRRKSESMMWIEKKNDKLYIGKDENVLKDMENLIELAFLIEAINNYRLIRLCKKRETNSQKRAARRIILGLSQFKKSKCRENNWIRITLRRKEMDQFLAKEEPEMIKKNPQKQWLWIKKKKKYWTLDVVFD